VKLALAGGPQSADFNLPPGWNGAALMSDLERAQARWRYMAHGKDALFEAFTLMAVMSQVPRTVLLLFPD
jgi:hypothetical protein